MNFCIKRITVGQWLENTYLIYNEEEGWIVDPGDDFELLNDVVNQERITLKGILNTHGHFDHLGAVSNFKENYNVPFYIHSRDKRLVGQANLYRKLAKGQGFFKTPAIDHFLDQAKEIPFGGESIKIIHTPGHSEGSVTFVIDNQLISGDLLFENRVGRTNLPGGNLESLKKSATTLLQNFKGYRVYPGHGNSFLITDEYEALILDEIKSWALK